MKSKAIEKYIDNRRSSKRDESDRIAQISWVKPIAEPTPTKANHPRNNCRNRLNQSNQPKKLRQSAQMLVERQK